MINITYGFAKSIVEEKSASEFIDSKIKEYPRLEQLYDGLKWRLARKPESGVKISRNPVYYIIKTVEWSFSKQNNLPALRVLYTFDENDVHIIAIDIIKT